MTTWKQTLAGLTLAALTLGLASLGAAAQDHHPQFNDHDRAAVRAWQGKHHDHPPVGFRDRDRLAPALEAQLRVGVVLDRDLRARLHPLPHDLVIGLAPPPPHYRYVVVGDHVCLIDPGFHLVDVIHLELNF